jgi:two-component system, chemotaxis family, chemotaxis protein CheY
MAGLNKLSVLVVDDNAHMRSIIVTILDAAGFGQISQASDGGHALKVMQGAIPDIIIIDLNMLPVDGLEFTRTIRRAPNSPAPHVPIIMMTAHTEPSKIFAARDAGINELVAKPISAKTLLDRIIAVIDRPRAFVTTKSYTGPCRRRGNAKKFTGPWQRETDDRTLNQVKTDQKT